MRATVATSAAGTWRGAACVASVAPDGIAGSGSAQKRASRSCTTGCCACWLSGVRAQPAKAGRQFGGVAASVSPSQAPRPKIVSQAATVLKCGRDPPCSRAITCSSRSHRAGSSSRRRCAARQASRRASVCPGRSGGGASSQPAAPRPSVISAAARTVAERRRRDGPVPAIASGPPRAIAPSASPGTAAQDTQASPADADRLPSEGPSPATGVHLSPT